MVMLVSGIHIGWGICSPQLRDQEWHLNSYPHEYMMVIMSWFLGAIIGSIMVMYIYTRFTKRQIYVSVPKQAPLFPLMKCLSSPPPVPRISTLCNQ